MSSGGIARGGLFLFIGSMIVNALGYVYWFFVSILSGAEIVGIANSVISLSTLVSGIAILGIPTGVQRFLGREFSRKNVKDINTYFWSSFALTLFLCLCSAALIWMIALLDIPLLGFSEIMLMLSGVMAFLGFYTIMSALFASVVKTEYIAVSSLASALTRISTGTFLVYLGFGWLGALTGAILGNISLAASMIFLASRELRRLGGISIRLSRKAAEESLHAGFISWLPAAIGLVGQQLAVLTVFGIQGGSQTGIFFVAYAVFGIVFMVPGSFTSILFPILSGMGDEGKRVAWTVLKVCMALACPLAVFLTIYSRVPLSLFGGEYVQATSTLSILAVSIIPTTFVSAVSSMVYARGLYRKTFAIGLAVNVPQAVLYFLFVPVYGGYGAGLAFLVGALMGLVAAICISKIVDFKVSYGKIITSVAVPSAVALLCYLIGVDWLVGGTLILLASVLGYGRLGVIERGDLAEIARAFASEKKVAKAGQRLNWLLRIIYGE